MVADARSVRLDVYVKDARGTVYDIEIQTVNTSFIIFICTFDLFGKGRHKYTFENRCCEEVRMDFFRSPTQRGKRAWKYQNLNGNMRIIMNSNHNDSACCLLQTVILHIFYQIGEASASAGSAGLQAAEIYILAFRSVFC